MDYGKEKLKQREKTATLNVFLSNLSRLEKMSDVNVTVYNDSSLKSSCLMLSKLNGFLHRHFTQYLETCATNSRETENVLVRVMW